MAMCMAHGYVHVMCLSMCMSMCLQTHKFGRCSLILDSAVGRANSCSNGHGVVRGLVVVPQLLPLTLEHTDEPFTLRNRGEWEASRDVCVSCTPDIKATLMREGGYNTAFANSPTAGYSIP